MDIISISATSRVVERHINDLFKSKPDVLQFFLKHPKRNTLEEALAKGLQGADAKKVLKSGPEHIDSVAREIVKFWCSAILHMQTESMKSHAEKRREEDANRRIEIAQDIVRDISPNIEEDDFDVEEI